jgi:hypothetical protein
MAKNYTATVAGIATASAVCNDGSDKFFEVARLNFGPVTLTNFDHYNYTELGDQCFNQSITPTRGQCGFSYDSQSSGAASQVWIWAWQDGEYTEVRGYAFTIYRPSATPGNCFNYAAAEVEFRLREFGSLDMRTLSGKVIPVYGSSQRERAGMSPACTNPSTWLDTSSATLTLTSVT